MFWLNVYFFLWSKPLIWVPVSFPSLLVPCIFCFISLCITFTFSSICNHTQPFLWTLWLSVFWILHLLGWLSLGRLAVFLEFWSVLSFGAYFFVLVYVLHCKGRRFRYSPGWGKPRCYIVVLYVGEGSEREQCRLLNSCPAFSHFSPLPTSKLSPLKCYPGADFWVGGLVYILGPCGSPMRLCVSPTTATWRGLYRQKFWGFISPHWNPGLHGLSCSLVVPPS